MILLSLNKNNSFKDQNKIISMREKSYSETDPYTNPELVSQSPLNRSKAKMLFSFGQS